MKKDVDGGTDVHFEAFQLSDQCIELWKDGWFVDDLPDLDPKLSRINKDVVVVGNRGGPSFLFGTARSIHGTSYPW